MAHVNLCEVKRHEVQKDSASACDDGILLKFISCQCREQNGDEAEEDQSDIEGQEIVAEDLEQDHHEVMEYELTADKADVLIPEDQFESLARKAHFPRIENIPRAVIEESESVPRRIAEIIEMRNEIDCRDDQNNDQERVFDIDFLELNRSELPERYQEQCDRYRPREIRDEVILQDIKIHQERDRKIDHCKDQ